MNPIRTLNATDARVHFGEVLRDTVERGTTVIVERAGKPAAVVLSIDRYERLQEAAGRARAGDALERLATLREKIARRYPEGLPVDAVDLIREGREERDADFEAPFRRR